MVASFKHLRDEKSFCDVTIATEGQHTKAHKMVMVINRFVSTLSTLVFLRFSAPVALTSRICLSRTLPSTRSSFWRTFHSCTSPLSWNSCMLARWYLVCVIRTICLTLRISKVNVAQDQLPAFLKTVEKLKIKGLAEGDQDKGDTMA